MNIRLIQTRANICNVTERINTYCDFSIITTDYERDGNIYEYNDRTGSKKILGSKLYYDNSGYYEDFNLNIHINFYDNADKLKKIKWIDEETLSLITVINFYNINHDLLLIMRILHERIESDFVPRSDHLLVDITPKLDIALIFSIIFSFLNLLALFLVLKKKEENNNYKRETTDIPIHKKIKLFFESNFKRPDAFEVICKLL
jgi:hypothetical protein